MAAVSSIYGQIAPAAKTDAEIRAECKAAWHRDGVICLNPEWITGWGERQQLIQIAEKQFGKRGK